CKSSADCTAPASQSALVRQTAATVALYALKFTNASNVVVFAPAPSKGTNLAFLFTRDASRRLLDRPLRSGAPAKLARTAAHRCLVTSLPAGGAVLVLGPPNAGAGSL